MSSAECCISLHLVADGMALMRVVLPKS